MFRFVVVCALVALVAAGPRPGPRPSNLVYSSYGLSVIPTAVSHQSRIEVESKPAVPPVVIKTTPVGATYSESVVVDSAGTHVINKPVYIATPAHQSVVKTVPSVTTYSHAQPVVATRLVDTQPLVSTQQVIAAQPVVATQRVLSSQPLVETRRVLSPQPLVAAQPVVAAQHLVSTQRLVEAHPVVSAQRIYSTQPYIQSQPLVATQRVVAQQQFAAAQPLVASQPVLSQTVLKQVPIQTYGYVKSVPGVHTLSSPVVLNKNVVSSYTQAIPAHYGYPPVGYKYVY